MENEKNIEEFDINKLIEEDYEDFLDTFEEDEENDRQERQSTPERVMKKKYEGKRIELVVKEDDELLKFLLANGNGKSRTTVKSYLTNRQVAVNEIVSKQFDARLKAGDVVTINLGTVGKEFRHPMLRIVYEDDHIILINKKYGLLSMASDTERLKTAYYILSDYVKKLDPNNRIFIIHRLDRETSGLLLFAKSLEVQHLFQQNWNENVLERKYVAVVEGFPKQDDGIIRSYLAENKAYNVYVTNNPNEGELAITAFKVLKKGKDNSLLELELETGKKNQIRVHMQQIGCPIIGDRKYGGGISPIGRLALHASLIRFVHPITGKEMVFDTGIPPMFLTALTLKRYTRY